MMSERMMEIGGAISALKDGKHVSRQIWSAFGPTRWLEYDFLDEGAAPVIVMVAGNLPNLRAAGPLPPFVEEIPNKLRDNEPWAPSHADLLANDWRIVPMQNKG